LGHRRFLNLKNLRRHIGRGNDLKALAVSIAVKGHVKSGLSLFFFIYYANNLKIKKKVRTPCNPAERINVFN
jgi:hypothetical protein